MSMKLMRTGLGSALMALVLHVGAPFAIAEAAVSSAADSPASAAPNPVTWPNFRGPGGNGHAVGAMPPVSWSAKEDRNILWKVRIPKHGISSPVLWHGQLFLTGADDAARQIYCFDTGTGKLLWQHDVNGLPGLDGTLPRVMEETGFAAPTAATDGRHVAAIFATGELVCVNMKGERVWARHLGLPRNHYGHASSLICHENLLLVQFDQSENSELLAFDLATGRPAWRVPRGDISWSSPILIDNKGRKELVLTNSKSVDGHDPKTGKRLWHVACLAGEMAPSAAHADGIVFVAVENATASAIDVSDHGSEPKILWQWNEALPDAPSPVASKDYLILPTGFGLVTCLDARTGRVLWEHPFREGFASSPILVNDRVYLGDLSGNMQVFKMDKEFALLGVSDIGEPVYATPAIVGNRIYIRGLTHLFCVGQRDGDSVEPGRDLGDGR